MISAELIEECQVLCADVAPELSGNCYVIDASLLEGVPHVAGNLATAFSRTTFIFDIRERLQAAGLWQGARPLISISGHDIAQQADYGEDFRSSVLSIMVHEIAHLVPFTPAPIPEKWIDSLDSPDVRQFQRDQAEVGSILDRTADPNNKYNVHDAAFVRRAIHLYCRARVLGWSIPFTNLFCGDLWYASQPPHYVDALFVEAVEMQCDTFEQIEAAKPPAEFSRLWGYNVALYENFREQKA